MDGAFGNSDYIKAFELFKNIADKDQSSYYNVLHTPIFKPDNTIDYKKMISMFTLVSEQGDQEICYNIGYLYENGIFFLRVKCYSVLVIPMLYLGILEQIIG
jgi:TPR repeat protein